jgi:hypothetical protein
VGIFILTKTECNVTKIERFCLELYPNPILKTRLPSLQLAGGLIAEQYFVSRYPVRFHTGTDVSKELAASIFKVEIDLKMKAV